MATILVVDDHTVNREYLITLLSHCGHRVLEAADGAEGLALARADSPDLIITDLLMPNLDGFEFAQRLRADPDQAPTRLIFYTATYLGPETLALARMCGVQQVLIKPLEPEEVLRAVEAALSRAPDPTQPLPSEEFHHRHLRLLTNKLYSHVAELEAFNADLEKRVERRTAELAEANARLASLALTDPLTGLYNRRGFLALSEEQLKLARRGQHGLYLLFVDMDELKHINDGFGHAAGDEALIDAAGCLRRTFRESDILARIGGDEFAGLAVEAVEKSLPVIEARLLANVEARNAQPASRFAIGLSLGAIFVDPNTTSTVEDLLIEADIAMYARKRGKRQPQ